MITIKLTAKQIKELQPLQKKAAKAYASGFGDNRGIIIAQVWPDRGNFTAHFYEHEKAKKIKEITVLK